MAKVTSGSFNTSAYSGRYLVLSWSATQSIADNTSSITWTLKGAGGSSGFYKAGNFKVIIAGETVYSSSARIDLYNGTTVASGTKVIKHNTDGSKSFSASAEAGIYYTAVNCSGSGSWELTDIPRAATITSAPNFNDEASPTVNYTNPAGANVTTLQLCITLDGSNDDIAYRDVSKTGSSYTFNLTTAERELLRSATTGSNSRTVKFYLKTVIGGSTYYSKVSKTLTIVNANPVLAPTVLDTGTISKTLTGDTSKIIRYYNTLRATINATAQKGASIKSVKITCGGKSSTANSAIFEYAETATVVFIATDSRGNSTKQTVAGELIPYIKPTCTLVKNNVSTDGEYVVSLKGQFYNGSFGAVANTITPQFRWRESGGTWSEWQTLSATASGNTYTAAATVTGLNYQASYDVQARAVDKIESFTATTRVLTVSSIPVFYWGKNRFKHNTSAIFSNHKYILGTTTDGMEIASFEPCNANNNVVIGAGAYQNSLNSNTNIYGGVNINLSCNGVVKIQGRQYGLNKVLATGSYWMNSSQTVNLSEAVSAQPNGIVLVFSLYRDNAAADASFHTFFIPKKQVELYSSYPMVFLLGINSSLNTFGAKYLYIYDTYIAGYGGNDDAGTAASGITFNNASFVLRNVIGV